MGSKSVSDGTSDSSDELLRLFQRALDALPMSVNIKDADGRYKFINEFQARHAGMPAAKIIGQEVGVAGGDTWRQVIRERDIHVLKTGQPMGPYRDDYVKLFGFDGFWVTFKAPFSLNEGDDPDHVATISFNVTPFVEVENRLRTETETDILTGLPNRRWIDRELDVIGTKAGRGSLTSDWLLVLDIDHFKSVNDQFGHSSGDCVLRETAVRLRESTRSCDTAARLGGEEFLVLVSNAAPDEAKMIAERIRLAFEDKPITSVEAMPTITVSIGAADIRDGDANDALKRADRALYTAKEAGRNCVVIAED